MIGVRCSCGWEMHAGRALKSTETREIVEDHLVNARGLAAYTLGVDDPKLLGDLVAREHVMSEIESAIEGGT